MIASRALVIIGGGPAGMTAAIEAARAGLHPVLIDEAPALGGQVYRRLPDAFRVNDAHGLEYDGARGGLLAHEYAAVAGQVEVRSNTSVLAVWPNREILWANNNRSGVLRAERLVIASGAYERAVPFPGWTFPGVMAAGGVHALLKTMRVRPGQRALVAGTGLLIFAVARRLHEAGIDVAAVLDAGDPPWTSDEFQKEWGEWSVITDAREHRKYLRDARVPLLSNHTVFEAHGPGEVHAASFGAVDATSWRPLKDQQQKIDVDLVVTGFGFVPNTELTELAGCQHEYVLDLGGWIPTRDDQMQTTVPGVFAVGDGAGIGGALVAAEEGRVAAITAAEQAGLLAPEEAARRRAGPCERLRALAELRGVLNEVSRPRAGLLELATSETLACRCEEVRFADVQSAVEQGARDLHAVKLCTRLGMGPCQGRNCAPPVGMHLCVATGRNAAAIGRINPRPPVRPVTLGALAAMEGAADSAQVDPLDAVGGGAL